MSLSPATAYAAAACAGSRVIRMAALRLGEESSTISMFRLGMWGSKAAYHATIRAARPFFHGRHMSELFCVILLGLIEGITEFLPISSTGHLLIAEHWLGRRSDTFNVVIQAGAILAVVFIYRR